MSDAWDTKDGRRRVRRDPPTIEDAAIAALGLTDDFESQIEIVTSLMAVSADEARRAILKTRVPRDESRVVLPSRAGLARSVIVERRTPRRPTAQIRSSAGRWGPG
jgi:hypothetical protein